MTTEQVTHHAEYASPGSFFSETGAVQLEARDVDEAVAKAPGHAFCFQLFDRYVIDFEYDKRRFQVAPKRTNESGRYYLGGETFTLEQVRAMGDDFRTLAANMNGNWPLVIRTRHGNWQPFDDGDTLLEVPGLSGAIR